MTAMDGVIRDISPCKDCPDRHPGCHDTCTRGYKQWKAKLEQAKKNRRDYMNKPFSKIM